MALTAEQKTLLNDLQLVIEGTGTKDIVQILEEAKTEDLFTVFKSFRVEKGDEDFSKSLFIIFLEAKQ